MSSPKRPLINMLSIQEHLQAFDEAQAVKSSLYVVFTDVQSIASAFIDWMRMQSDAGVSIEGYRHARSLIHSAVEYHGWSMHELCIAARLDPMFANCVGILYP